MKVFVGFLGDTAAEDFGRIRIAPAFVLIFRGQADHGDPTAGGIKEPGIGAGFVDGPGFVISLDLFGQKPKEFGFIIATEQMRKHAF